jgi:hypothetical protein
MLTVWGFGRTIPGQGALLPQLGKTTISFMAGSNWHTISESGFPGEREALEFVRSRLPDREPYRAWANFEFVADDGSINEVDLLVLADEDPLAPPMRVQERLRAVPSPPGVEPLGDTRLLRVAVLASEHAAVSSRQEIYPRSMDALRALKLSQGALLGASQLSVEEVRQRVAGRYPEAAALPDRPELDDLLKTAGFDFEWDPTAGRGGAYRSRLRESLVTSTPSAPIRRHPTQPGPPAAEITPEVARARQFEERLRRAISDPAFIAMTVEPRGYFLARDELCRRFPVQPIDVEATFLEALRSEAEKAKVKWDRVLAADAVPGSDDWNKLMVLVRRAVP